MASWVFRCYLDPTGIDVIDAWYQAQPENLQAKFDTRLRFLRQQERHNWIRPYFDTLAGECAGLGELRFEFKNVQYRILGFASGKMEYIWVFVAKEVARRFVPKRACGQALKRKAEVETDRRRSRDCKFD
jgi:hypothetical protein